MTELDDVSATSPIAACPSCGAAAAGRFCAECGERTTGRVDPTVVAFLRDALYELLNADSRVWRSFRSLFLEPGRLSEEYLAGRRRPWLSPVQLFLICNVAFFILLEFLPAHVFTTRLIDHFNSHPYGTLILDMDARPGLTFRELMADQEAFRRYATTFDAVTAGPAKSLVFIMIPGIALLLNALNARRRRYFVEHLVFATHLFAVLIVMIVAAVGVAMLLMRGMRLFGFPYTGSEDGLFGLVLLGVFLPWLIPGLRRFYHQHFGIAVLKVPFFIVGLYGVLIAYRLTLFLLTVRLV
jgi:hypothetical protein